MKYVKLFEQFLIVENSIDVHDKVKSDPALAKKLLRYANEEDEDGDRDYQESYTVQTKPPNWDGPLMTFGTLDAIFGMLGRNVDEAPFDWGVNVAADRIEYFAGDDDYSIPFKLQEAKLKEVIKVITLAMKKAKAAYDKRMEKYQ